MRGLRVIGGYGGILERVDICAEDLRSRQSRLRMQQPI